jgi:hypothetical protein
MSIPTTKLNKTATTYAQRIPGTNVVKLYPTEALESQSGFANVSRSGDILESANRGHSNGGEPPMDNTHKYVTKKRLKRETKGIISRIDELDTNLHKDVSAEITKAKLHAIIWIIATGLTATGVFSTIVVFAIQHLK